MSRHAGRRLHAALFTGAVLAVPAAARAQETPPPSSGPAAAPAPQPLSTAGAKRVYLPADFARFAPKTAFDMLAQVPGFTIREVDQERGLGQASENVLVNGDRIANKSGGAVDELRKVAAADVVRIEIVDASSLGIAGLTGQVANVVVKSSGGHGRFEWQPTFRAHFARPYWFQGSVSYSSKLEGVDYTLSVEDQGGRGGFGGPVLITGPTGALIERRDQRFHAETDVVTAKLKLGFKGPGSAKGNLTLAGSPYRGPVSNADRRIRADGDNRSRLILSRLEGFFYDVSGDYDLALAGGRLKLIGLRHFDHEPVVQTQTLRFDRGAATTGTRFGRNSRIAETVGRAEYSWKGGRNAWQFSFERAFNALDQRGSLAALSPSGSFDPIDFAEGSGRVEEVRYEATATLSRPLGKTLDLQLVIGAEQSSLARVDGNLAPRRFFRPKGSVSLGWRPSPGWDASLKLGRRVGQIDFYDFLSQPNLAQDRRNAGNPDLVPPQSWELEGEVGRELGAWGKTRLRGYYHRIDDIVDFVPIGIDDAGVGNLPRATRFGMESISTIQFDPIGWRGAKLDATLAIERTIVRDPLTGIDRSISGNQDASIELALRHDVPHSRFAWGVQGEYSHNSRVYYPTEISRSGEGPWFVSAFVERKDFHGLTLRMSMINLLDSRHRLDRYVYDGRRTTSPMLFREYHDQLIGPIVQFSVKGSF